MSSLIQRGTVTRFYAGRGFGFITSEYGKDIFVHRSAIVGDSHTALMNGQVVEFEVVESDRGLEARNVRRLSAGKTKNVFDTP